MNEQWLESNIPQISPDAKFREELHRALQASYERQQTQHQLQRHWRPFSRKATIFAALLGAIALTAAIAFWLRPHLRR